MKISYFQKGFNYSQDGPGNRLVYHLCGCNLTCPWCANPEGMHLHGRKEKQDEIDHIVDEILSARPMFFEGGGITLTGGEPTVQFEEIYELLYKVHEAGVSTCIETNGTSSRMVELFPLLDILIMDIKQPDSAAHRKWTGLGNEKIKENIVKAAMTDKPLFLRVPLIHGVNDSDEALEGFIDFFRSVQREGVTVEFLPYHEYGKQKWLEENRPYRMTDDAFITEDKLRLFTETCVSNGIRIIKT